jgi:hypothetical protein
LGLPMFLPRYFSFLALNIVLGFTLVLELEQRAKVVSYRRYVLVGVLSCVAINSLFYLRHNLNRAKVVRAEFAAVSSPLPSKRVQATVLMASPKRFKSALCQGEAVFSDDYSAAEFMLHLCPHKFVSLKKLNTQIFPPSTEWRELNRSPKILVFHSSVPSRELFHDELGFFRYASRVSLDHYRQVRNGEYEIWVRSDFDRG